MKSNRVITNVKIVKGEFLDVTYFRPDGDTKTKVIESHKRPVHPDMLSAFKTLDIHFALLMELVEPKQVRQINEPDPKLTESLKVRSYSIGGTDDDPGIVLTGSKTMKTGKVSTMNTPFIRFNENELTAYKYITDLLDAKSLVEFEVEKYLDEGKVAPDVQGNLFDQVPAAKDQTNVAAWNPDDITDENDIDDNDIDDDDETDDGVSVAAPKKRIRRTKAQIEADRANGKKK